MMPSRPTLAIRATLLVLLALIPVPPLFGASLFFGQIPGISSVTQAAAAPTPAQPEISDDPLGRATPHGTVLGFVKAANTGDWDTAAQYLDTKQKGALADELAKQLKAVLDSDNSINLNNISRNPAGTQNPDEKPNQELIGNTAISGGKLPIILDKVKHGDDPAIWLFSQDTLRQIPEAYNDLSGPSAFEQKLPTWLQREFLSTPLWRWFVLLAGIGLVLALGSWINRVVYPLLRTLAKRVGGESAVEKVRSVRAPLRLLFFAVILLLFSATANSLLGRSFWHNIGLLVLVIAITWMLWRSVGLISELSVARLKRVQSTDRIALAGLIGRLSQIGILIIGLLVVLQLRGVNLTAALTGLGIGGLAVAFAAQKTLENLFGGIMIISDRPIRIGDQCKIGNVEGYVLDIGLRSTRIRTFNRTIVTIPNGQLSTMNVENYTFRDKYWFRHIINLKYDTTAEQMEKVLSGIRKLLEEEPRIETSTFRANFTTIGSVSDDIEISAYIFADNYGGSLVVQESLLLKILSIVESAGAEFSLPTQVTKVEGSSPHPGL